MNRKQNSHYASDIRRMGLWLRIAFCCAFMATAMLTSCVKERLEQQPDNNGAIRLQIKAAISNGVETKAPILGTNFPVSDAGAISNIGLFMMQSDGTTPYATGSENMTAELTGKTGPIYTCRYKYRDGDWMQTLSFYINQTIKLWGYYPRNESATAEVIPFDLTVTSEQNDQTDILWCLPQEVKATSANYQQSVSLTFKHAYALLEFQIKKKIEDPAKPATFKRIDVMNIAGKSWITNKGNINPQTGAFSATATAGTVSVNCSATLASDSYTTIRVMVPSFSGAYTDNDIEVQFTGDDLVIQKFLIKKSYLSEKSGAFGFTAGLKYSFKLLYNNFGEGSLTLLPWDNDGENGNVGDDSAGGTVNISPWTTIDNDLDIGDSPYKGPDWPGVGKGGRIIISSNEFGGVDQSTLLTDDQKTWLNNTNNSTETYHQDSTYNKVSPKFEVAVSDCNFTNIPELGNTSAMYVWTEKIFMACDKYSENGAPRGTWRVPTLKELQLIYKLKAKLTGADQWKETDCYWSSTAHTTQATYAWNVQFSSVYGGGSVTGYKDSPYFVRCIRDL